MGVAENKINFSYNFIDVQFLSWYANEAAIEDTLKWEPEFEIAFDHSPATHSVAYMDALLYLRINKDKFAASIAVRTVFSLTKANEDKYHDKTIAWLMDNAIAHCRGMCSIKCMEEKIALPVIPYFTFNQLWTKANLVIFKPSVSALSHAKELSERNITALSGGKVIGINKIRSAILWFDVLDEALYEITPTGENKLTASINFNYDYERANETEWKMHFDFGIKCTPLAEIKVRTSYQIECGEEELFTNNVLAPMVEEAFTNCITAFKEQCAENKLPFKGDLKLDEQFITGLCGDIINKYFGTRKPDDERNKEMLKDGLRLTVGGNTQLLVKGTFMIMDEILFLNHAFNRKANVKLMADNILMETKYYTVKQNCMQIEKGPIALSWLHSIMYCICVDVAIQILLSDHAQTLEKVLHKNNFTELRQREFIKFGNDLLSRLNQSLKESGTRITNLEERKDWAALIQ